MKKGFVAPAIVLVLAVLCFPLLFPSSLFQTVEAQSLIPTTVPHDTSGKHETDVRIQVFYDALMNGNSASAYDEFVRQSLFTPIEVEQLSTQFRNRHTELSIRFGKIVDYKMYDTKWIDEDTVLSRYILKHENSPLVWMFGFYRKPTTTTGIANDNPWMLISVNFDTDLRLLQQQ